MGSGCQNYREALPMYRPYQHGPVPIGLQPLHRGYVKVIGLPKFSAVTCSFARIKVSSW